MESIFTQCPKCRTVFRVRPEQIQAAHGKVRCSRCQSVFLAIEHRYDPASAQAPAEANKPQSAEKKSTGATTQTTASKMPAAAPVQLARQNKPPAKPQAESRKPEAPQEDWFDLTAAQPDAAASAGQGQMVPEASVTAGKEADAPLSEEEQLNEDLFNLFAEPETPETNTQMPASERKPSAPPEPTAEDRLEELLVDLTLAKASPPADAIADLEEMVAADSSELQTTLDFSAEEEAEEVPASSPPDSYSLPPELEARPLRCTVKTLSYLAGILLLIAGLVVQYAYSHRIALMEHDSLRPWLTRLCDLMQCPLPPPRALDKIELADHLVQSHPRYQHSLLITATLINRADYAQPFPIVEVVMSDLQQKVVARRQFRPEQYLVGDTAEMGFIPNVEVPLMLEVVDPGENAVGFEFNFY